MRIAPITTVIGFAVEHAPDFTVRLPCLLHEPPVDEAGNATKTLSNEILEVCLVRIGCVQTE